MALDYVTIDMLNERMTTAMVDSLCRGLTGSAKTQFLTDVLERAEDRVDAYAQKLYHLPLPTSYIVIEWVLATAEYEMYRRGPGNNIPDKFDKSFETTTKELALMTEGKIYPEGALIRKNSQGISVDMTSDCPNFDENTFRRF